MKIKWLIAPLAIFSALSVPSAAEGPQAPPSDAVLMFVAAWCAPCLAELARFSTLEAAARPRRLLIVTVDEDMRNAEMTRHFAPGQKLAISPAAGWDLLRHLSDGRAAGLPYAVMTNGAGKPCAVRNRGLVEGEVHAMAKECAR